MVSSVFGGTPPPRLHVMSFNLRRRLPAWLSRPADRWPDRVPLVTELLRAERPDVLGVQEALPTQDDDVLAALGPEYQRIGTGREADGAGERCTVYWRADRLELVGWHQLALSPTPEVAGSRGWGNPLPRVAVVADFLDRSDGGPLSVINTHLDPFSKRSQLESARLLVEVAETKGGSTVLMGDFNADRRSAAVAELLGSSLADSWAAARERSTPEWRTYSGYRAPRRGPRIDWILVGADFAVEDAAVNGRRFDGRAASDHEPVQTVLVRRDVPRSFE
jgi:endonuclease/exonuclease/phosphatase family metal-dependent hydrolase